MAEKATTISDILSGMEEDVYDAVHYAAALTLLAETHHLPQDERNGAMKIAFHAYDAAVRVRDAWEQLNGLSTRGGTND